MEGVIAARNAVGARDSGEGRQRRRRPRVAVAYLDRHVRPGGGAERDHNIADLDLLTHVQNEPGALLEAAEYGIAEVKVGVPGGGRVTVDRQRCELVVLVAVRLP